MNSIGYKDSRQSALNSLGPVKPANWIKYLVYGLLMLGIYYSTLYQLVTEAWQRDGYSYCYLIPFVVLYLILINKEKFIQLPSEPSWKGLVPLLLGLFLFWVGELGGEYLTLYLSFWLVMVGILWMHLGWEKMKIIGFALLFSLTMFPAPPFINTKVMLQLRLISSKLGVDIIQIFGLPAYREGNIIDLGFTQLQVVEACSGLHSLISLVVLCLLLIYFFKDHWWKRSLLLISSVPLSIFANSMRIAITAILHNHFGAEVAEGFFHGFSGLIIFAVCIPVLLLEMKILKYLPPSDKISLFRSEENNKGRTQIIETNPTAKIKENLLSGTIRIKDYELLRQPASIIAMILLGSTMAFSHGVQFREKTPIKSSLAQFPLTIGEWTAKKHETLAQRFIDRLDLSEYVMADYSNSAGKSINLYIAYYESQSKGKSIHSPASCLPGSGWSFDQSGKVIISSAHHSLDNSEVNRAVMQLGRSKQISYYWFPTRGRVLNDAYQLKIYNFWDALTRQRTDGALVRLITKVYPDEKLKDAEERLQQFVRNLVSILEDYIPGEDLALIERKSSIRR